VPNPTDTARALVERFERYLTSAIYHPSMSNKRDADTARAALLAHVDTLRIERDGFKELYEEWLTWAKGAVEKCKPEIPPSDSPQAQGIIDERLAHVAGVEQLATFGAKVLLEFHNHGSRGDVDGGWLQDTAVDSGVMYRTERKIPCCDLCNCRGYLTDGDWSECVPITNQDLVYALATRPTEARDE